jgi:hypothetical protein
MLNRVTLTATGLVAVLVCREDRWIREGLRVTRQLVACRGREAREASVPLLVLLLPTKGTVYAAALEAGRRRLDGTYEAPVGHERRIRKEIGALLSGEGIAVVDSPAPLMLALVPGVAAYPAMSEAAARPRPAVGSWPGVSAAARDRGDG